jgi:Holliday junction resolvase
LDLKTYKKGANAERELLQRLHKQGFAIVRAAGSGTTPLPSPDLVALKGEKRFGFECKAWNSKYLHLDHKQMEELMEWGRIAGTEMLIAWKVPLKGWLFLSPQDFNKASKNYIISRKNAFKKAQKLEVILGKQAKLNL